MESPKHYKKLDVYSRKMAFIYQIRAILVCGVFIAAGLSLMQKASVFAVFFSFLWIIILAVSGTLYTVYCANYSVFINSEYIIIKYKIFSRVTVTVNRSEIAVQKSFESPLMKMLSVKNIVLCLPGARVSVKGVGKNYNTL